MKKNKFMRLASFLLVAVLLTTCAVSSSFAKYVTEGTGSDSARVARWGVTVTANGSTFASSYTKDDTTFTLDANSVVSAYGDDVVAPGTSGDMVSMTLTGIPEVAARVTYVATIELNDKWVYSDDSFYCPLIITVNDTAIDGRTYNDSTSFISALKTAIDGYSKDYAAGTNLSEKSTDSLKISWSWPFDDSETANDVKDTYLGDQAAAGNYGTISIKVKTTVTQID